MHGLRREGDGRSASARRSGSEHWPAGLDPRGLGGRGCQDGLLELGYPRKRDRARTGQITRGIDRRVEGRRDAEDAHQRRGVSRPVADVARHRAGLGDRVGAESGGTKGPRIPLHAVGPRPAPVRASGGAGATDTAGLECRLVAGAGVRPGAALPGRIEARAVAGAGARSAAAAGGHVEPRALRVRIVMRTPRERVPFEAAGALAVGIAAEAAEDVVLADAGARGRCAAAAVGHMEPRALRVRIVAHGRQARRSRRQGERDGEVADVRGGGRRAVVGSREALADGGCGRRAGHTIVGPTVTRIRPGTGAGGRTGSCLEACAAGHGHTGPRAPGVRAVRVAIARPTIVGAGVACLGAHWAHLDTRRIREQIPVEVEGRGQRQADSRGTGRAVRRADGVLRHRVDDADARRRAARVRYRERRAEQAPGARAVPVAARVGRGEGTEGERHPVACSLPGKRAAHIGYGVREGYAVAAAARVETAAGEVREGAARGVKRRTAAAAPDAGRERELGGTRARAAAGARDGDGRRRRRGGRRGRAQPRLRLAEERDLGLGFPGLSADLAAPRLGPVLLRAHRDAGEGPAHGARAVGLDVDLPDSVAQARGVDVLVLEVLRRAATLGLVHAQRHLEDTLLAHRRLADRALVRDEAARLLLEPGRALALRVARPGRECDGGGEHEDGREHGPGSEVARLALLHRGPPLSAGSMRLPG